MPVGCSGGGDRGFEHDGGRAQEGSSPEGKPAQPPANGVRAKDSAGARDEAGAASPLSGGQQVDDQQQDRQKQPAGRTGRIKQVAPPWQKRLSRELQSLQQQPVDGQKQDQSQKPTGRIKKAKRLSRELQSLQQQPVEEQQQDQPRQSAGRIKKTKRLSRELQSLQQQPLPQAQDDAQGLRQREREGQPRQAAEGEPCAKRARGDPAPPPVQRTQAATGKQAEPVQGEPVKKRIKKTGRPKMGNAAAAPQGAQPAGAGLQATTASQQSAPQPAAGRPGGGADAEPQAHPAGSSQPGTAAREQQAGQAEAGEHPAREENSQRQSGTVSRGAPAPREHSSDPPAAAAAPAAAAPGGRPPGRQGIKTEAAGEPAERQQPPEQAQQQAAQQQSMPRHAVLPAGPFAAHLAPLAGVLRHRPGRVLAAALLLHGALAAREPAGEGSGHALAWPVTANFLRAVLPPAAVHRLADSARGYAAVAAAAAAARREQAELAVKQQLQEQQLAALQAAIRQQQQQQQQQPVAAGGPAPMHVGSRVQQAAHPRAPGEHGGHGLVGAAKRKACKPRSTHETLGLPAAATAAGSSGGRRSGSEPPSSGRALRRKVRQPERLEAQRGSAKAHNALQAAEGGGGGAGGTKQGRAGPPLCDIPVPQEPLPRWGAQRARSVHSAAQDIQGLPPLSALAARLGSSPVVVAETQQLHRELRDARERHTGLQSRLSQLQQQLARQQGGRTRTQRGDAGLLQRERMADQQAVLAVEANQLRTERLQLEQERKEFRAVVEALAQSVLQPGGGSQLSGVAAAAIQAVAGAIGAPSHPPPSQQQQQQLGYSHVSSVSSALHRENAHAARQVQAGARPVATLHGAPPTAQPRALGAGWAAAQPQASQAAAGRPGSSTIPLGPGVGSARPLLNRLARAPSPPLARPQQAAGQPASWPALPQGWPVLGPLQQAPAGTPSEPGSSNMQHAAGQLQDALKGLLAQASQRAQQAHPAASPGLLPVGAAAPAQQAQQAAQRPAQAPDLSFLQALVSNGRVTPEALGQVLTNLLASGNRGGGVQQAQQAQRPAGMPGQAGQQPRRQAAKPPAQHAPPPTQRQPVQPQQQASHSPPVAAGGAQRYLSLAAQRLLSDGPAGLSPGAAAVASGHTQPITTGAAGMPAPQPGNVRTVPPPAAMPRLPAQQLSQQQQPAAPRGQPLPPRRAEQQPAPAALPAVVLPPLLKSQLALLPPEVQPQLELGIAKLCRDLASGNLQLDKLLGSLDLDAEQRNRLAQLLQQLLVPQAAGEQPAGQGPAPQAPVAARPQPQPLIVRARPVAVQPAPASAQQLLPPPHVQQLAHLVDALDRRLQQSHTVQRAAAQPVAAGHPPTAGAGATSTQAPGQAASPASAPVEQRLDVKVEASAPPVAPAAASPAVAHAAPEAASPARSGGAAAPPADGAGSAAAGEGARPASAREPASQAPGAQPTAASQRSGSGAATPEVSPSPVGDRGTPDCEAPPGMAAPRHKTASPVLQQVTDDDVAPVHKQLPPIRTSSIPEALRRAAVWQRAMSAAAAAQAPPPAAASQRAGPAQPAPARAAAPAAPHDCKRKSPEPAAAEEEFAAEPSLALDPPAKQARVEAGPAAAAGGVAAGSAAAAAAPVPGGDGAEQLPSPDLPQPT